MPIAQGARSQLAIKTQTGLGVVAAGNYTRLPFNSQSMKYDIASFESQQIRGDREIEDYRHGARSASGSISCELRDVDHEPLIASALFNPWNSDWNRIGVAAQYLSIEDGALDISQFRKFSDMVVSRAKFRFVPNTMVMMDCDLVGTTMSIAATTQAGVLQPATNNTPYDSINGALYDNAAETGNELAIITSMEIDINNSAQPIFALGSVNAVDIERGPGRVTGTLTAYYQDATWINRHINETEFSLVMNITDPLGNALEFRMDRCKANAADVPVSNMQSRIITMPFVALRPPNSPLSAGGPSALVINKV